MALACSRNGRRWSADDDASIGTDRHIFLSCKMCRFGLISLIDTSMRSAHGVPMRHTCADLRAELQVSPCRSRVCDQPRQFLTYLPMPKPLALQTLAEWQHMCAVSAHM